MKTYGESGGIAPPFLSSALDGGEYQDLLGSCIGVRERLVTEQESNR